MQQGFRTQEAGLPSLRPGARPGRRPYEGGFVRRSRIGGLSEAVRTPCMHAMLQPGSMQMPPAVQSSACSISAAFFSSKIFCKINTVAFSFVFDKYCLIID
jgi:hypothetical protein